MSDRYVLVQDCDSHWYVIPARNLEVWFELFDDEECPEFPAWAHEVGGSYTSVTFEKPEIFGEAVR